MRHSSCIFHPCYLLPHFQRPQIGHSQQTTIHNHINNVFPSTKKPSTFLFLEQFGQKISASRLNKSDKVTFKQFLFFVLLFSVSQFTLIGLILGYCFHFMCRYILPHFMQNKLHILHIGLGLICVRIFRLSLNKRVSKQRY